MRRRQGPAVWLLFFFNDTATTEIYTLSLHDALPISAQTAMDALVAQVKRQVVKLGYIVVLQTAGRSAAYNPHLHVIMTDRKSTRLNSSHANISYAVFCLKKKFVPLTSIFQYLQPVTP